MRRLMKVVTVLLVLVLSITQAHGHQAGSWVGQRVIIRSGTVLRIGRQVVEEENRKASSRTRARSLPRAGPAPTNVLIQ